MKLGLQLEFFGLIYFTRQEENLNVVCIHNTWKVNVHSYLESEAVYRQRYLCRFINVKLCLLWDAYFFLQFWKVQGAGARWCWRLWKSTAVPLNKTEDKVGDISAHESVMKRTGYTLNTVVCLLDSVQLNFYHCGQYFKWWKIVQYPHCCIIAWMVQTLDWATGLTLLGQSSFLGSCSPAVNQRISYKDSVLNCSPYDMKTRANSAV